MREKHGDEGRGSEKKETQRDIHYFPLEKEVEELVSPPDYQDLAAPSPKDYSEESPHGIATSIKRVLANDIVAGMILVSAAILALILANVPSPVREGYMALSNLEFGPRSLGLHLPVHEWAQDGILTLFFFAVGLELKQEFAIGSLHNIKVAAMPIIAAVFGMIGPATVYLVVTAISGDNAWHGWAIPTATDIAFAVAILQIFGRGLPLAARTFLLTLAVADDLGGILVIAIFYATGMKFISLLLAFVCAAIFGFLAQKRWGRWWILVPLGIVTWYFMFDSGVHATISGVLLGMTVPAKQLPGESEPETERLTEAVNPFSAGLAVPIFAFFAAGVNVVDVAGGPLNVITHPIALSVMLAMPLGKVLGIFGSVALFTKVTPLTLGEGVSLRDVLPVSLTAGIGFTVALLISHLAFRGDAELTQAGSLGVLMGTFASVILAAITLQIRVRHLKAAGKIQS